MNTGSRMIFSTAPVMTAIEDIFTEDSALAAQFMLCAGKLASAATNIQKAYSFACGTDTGRWPLARSAHWAWE